MNSTVFSIKRCFLRTVHLGRKVLAQFWLTPARFDALDPLDLLLDLFRLLAEGAA